MFTCTTVLAGVMTLLTVPFTVTFSAFGFRRMRSCTAVTPVPVAMKQTASTRNFPVWKGSGSGFVVGPVVSVVVLMTTPAARSCASPKNCWDMRTPSHSRVDELLDHVARRGVLIRALNRRRDGANPPARKHAALHHPSGAFVATHQAG